MKKYFEYIGLIIFTGFGFFYTNKVTDLMNNKDPLMIFVLEKSLQEIIILYVKKDMLLMKV